MGEGSNGGGRKIRMITEPGAFGQPGFMIVIRHRKEDDSKVVDVQSYAVLAGNRDEQLQRIEEFKKIEIVKPSLVSFTVLEFIEETRPLEEPEPTKIVRPTVRDVRHFNRSKYDPQ